MTGRKNHRARRLLTLALFLPLPFSGGCDVGLGWLYMKMGDSQRIKGQKLLTEDNERARFKNADRLYRKAIENYDEAILYEVPHLEVYYKKGYSYLLLNPPQLEGAWSCFEAGLSKTEYHKEWTLSRKDDDTKAPVRDQRTKEQKEADLKAAQSDTMSPGAAAATPTPAPEVQKAAATDSLKVQVAIQKLSKQAEEESFLDLLNDIPEPNPNETLSNILSGLGLCYFLKGIQDRTPVDSSEDKTFSLAAKYLEVADKFSQHPDTVQPTSMMDKLQNSLDLLEIIQPVPASVLLARVHLYLARRLKDKGQEGLALNRLANAEDALEKVKIYYDDEPFFRTELAQLHYLRYQVTKKEQEHLEKAWKAMDGMKDPPGYYEAHHANLLKAEIQLERKDLDPAGKTLTDLLYLDPEDGKTLLLEARRIALKDNDFAKVKDIFERMLTREEFKGNLEFLLETGHIYSLMGLHENAKDQYLSASYVEPKDIQTLYYLGMSYKALNDKKNSDICFKRVMSIDITSTFAKEVAPFVESAAAAVPKPAGQTEELQP